MTTMHLAVRQLLRLAAVAWFVVRGLRHRRHHHHHHDAGLRGSAGSTCFKGPLSWRGVNGELRVNSETFHLKGCKWYGFETAKNAVEGLDVRTLDDVLQFLQDNRFNAIRFPFSLKFALSYDEPVNSTVFKDADLNGMTKRQLLNRVIERAAAHNLLVLLDMHQLNDHMIPQLWFDEQYSMDDVLKGWDTMLGDLKGHWNVMGLDLKNEPWGSAQWGDGSAPETDWNVAAQQIGAHLLEAHPDWEGLIFVEGIDFSRDFRGFSEHPLDFGKPEWNERLVLSPHQYGPSVSHSALFGEPTFPNNPPAEWTKKWAFLKNASTAPVVLGEWGHPIHDTSKIGGRYVDKDKTWQDFFADFLLEKCLSDQFTWDLNPTSADTGGLLKDDWVTPEEGKLAVVACVQPDPSVLSQNAKNGRVCFSPGSYANAKCAPTQQRQRRRLSGRNIK